MMEHSTLNAIALLSQVVSSSGVKMSVVGSLGLFVGLLLILYLATKASGRTIGIVLGAVILLPLFSFLFLRVSYQKHTVTTSNMPQSWDTSGNSIAEPALSNQELWDRLTKSRIKLDVEPAEKPPTSEEDEDRALEQDDTESTPPKPDWVDNPPKRMGNLYSRVVVSDLFSTVEECHQDLEEQLLDAVRERIQTLVDERVGQIVLVPDPISFGIGLSYIMREICQDEFTETVSASFGEMKRVHVLMEFSPAIENQLRTAWQKNERRHRLFTVGRFAAIAFSLLAGIYGVLKFDTWTRGYYTKRLLAGVSVAIILVVILNFA